MMIFWAITACALFAIVSAQNTFNVTVGKDNNLAFDPPFISGYTSADTINFLVYQATPPYGITESSFDQPCMSLPTGILIYEQSDDPIHAISQQIPISAGQPRWFQVSNANRCTAGMVFAINTDQQTYNAFKEKATGKSVGSSSTSPASGNSPSTTASSPSPTTSTKPASGATTHAISMQTIVAFLAGLNLLIQVIA